MPADRVIAVTSGKGGVGKSTISLNLALALAQRGLRVGLLDADLYGPDIPLMVNLKRSELRERWLLGRAGATGGPVVLEPVERFGLKLMSVGFLIGEGQAMTLPAPLLQAALRQLLSDVEWGSLDFLLVDTPPGTGDLQQELLTLGAVGDAIVVVGPQDVAHLDGRKVVDLLRSAGVSIIGGVENMAALTCPHCGESIDVFPPAPEERTIWADGVTKLGSIPLDPLLASSRNGHTPLLLAAPDGPQAVAFHRLAERIAGSR